MQSLVDQFSGAGWSKVSNARDSLLINGQTSIPYLIQLMEDKRRFEKLQGTADLIYPGALEYYGHGYYIDYDLDWVSIRAGWVLEELTFQNFGFHQCQITNFDSLQTHKENYKNYIKSRLPDSNFRQQEFKNLQLSVEKAKQWWFNNKKHWNNLEALKEALYSEDEFRISAAIRHLRYPNYNIDGFTDSYYLRELKPRLEQLATSENESISFQAKQKLNWD